MPSQALTTWASTRIPRLQELERVHAELTGTAPGRRWFTDQLDRSYVVVLASQFQAFCRDLHSEAAAVIASQGSTAVQPLVEASLTLNRHLDRGNANPGNVGSDFARFGFDLWPALYGVDRRNERRRERLEQLIIWRNSIAHESLISEGDQTKLADTKPTLSWGRRWRRAMDALARHLDRAVGDGVESLIGTRPW